MRILHIVCLGIIVRYSNGGRLILRSNGLQTQDLRTFIEVAANQSFSSGAGNRGIGQPSATRSIRRLELELAVKLIDRNIRPVQLTLAGIEFLQFAQETITHLELVTKEFFKPDPNLRGTINIIASSTPGELLVPHMLNQFIEHFPGVRPRMVITDSNEVYFQLLNNNFDVGFVGTFNPNSKLNFSKIAQDEIILAVGKNHKFFGRNSISVEELVDERLILRDKGSGTLRTLYRALKSSGSRLPEHKIAMVVGNTRAVLTAVRENIGSGFISSLALESEITTEIRGVKLNGLNLERNLYVVHKKDHANSQIVQEFIRFAPSFQ